ncbi:hypothetical protein FRC07_003129 [Ceratobasidium sp. 392]|nr:hypothetical protein FRC07_003129 [Ceratobasidium sp. 392]
MVHCVPDETVPSEIQSLDKALSPKLPPSTLPRPPQTDKEPDHSSNSRVRRSSPSPLADKRSEQAPHCVSRSPRRDRSLSSRHGRSPSPHRTRLPSARAVHPPSSRQLAPSLFAISWRRAVRPNEEGFEGSYTANKRAHSAEPDSPARPSASRAPAPDAHRAPANSSRAVDRSQAADYSRGRTDLPRDRTTMTSHTQPAPNARHNPPTHPPSSDDYGNYNDLQTAPNLSSSRTCNYLLALTELVEELEETKDGKEAICGSTRRVEVKSPEPEAQKGLKTTKKGDA